MDEILSHLRSRPGATEGFPFGPGALVFKVGGKMFALVAPDETPPRVTLKGDPDDNLALRAQFSAVQPGYYMNKQHWNTVTLDGSIPEDALRELLDASYTLVVQSLPKAARAELTDGKEAVRV